MDDLYLTSLEGISLSASFPVIVEIDIEGGLVLSYVRHAVDRSPFLCLLILLLFSVAIFHLCKVVIAAAVMPL